MNTHDRPLIPYGGLTGSDGQPYHAERRLIDAINAAIVLERPLLLTGEPGCGKSDFAFAVARSVGVKLLESHVRSDSRARDLLYHYDALHRFGDAHQLDDAIRKRSADATHYVKLLPLGEALVAPNRQVVLIDEIDKAPRDLPNDLLRELDRGDFEIIEIPSSATPPSERPPGTLARIMKRPPGASQPIIIITSNVERQLPDPFLRRCMFFHVKFPDDARLTDILRSRAGGIPYVDKLVDLFLTLRDVPRLTKKPATSELIDWAKDLEARSNQAEMAKAIESLWASLEQQAKADKTIRRLPEGKWKALPGLHCLLKMREDLEAVGC